MLRRAVFYVPSKVVQIRSISAITDSAAAVARKWRWNPGPIGIAVVVCDDSDARSRGSSRLNRATSKGTGDPGFDGNDDDLALAA